MKLFVALSLYRNAEFLLWLAVFIASVKASETSAFALVYSVLAGSRIDQSDATDWALNQQ